MRYYGRIHTAVRPHHFQFLSLLAQLVVVFLIFTSQASAVIRFTSRQLFLYDTTPGATTSYKLSFTYTTATTVGSLDLLFCENPIPDLPCVAPPGLDVSNAQLSEQHGVTGYSISQATANHLVLSRTPGTISSLLSTYVFSNMVNPSDDTHSFAIRLSDYASTDASGPVIDLGSVISSAAEGISVSTQVPPMLVFCLAHEVNLGCTDLSGGNFSDMGTLSPTDTLTATSQMAAGTNASLGYTISTYGTTMSAGTNIIDSLGSPTASLTGDNQFGLNLVANTSPAIGDNPDGPLANAAPEPDFSVPNQFMFKNGAVVASAPHVSLMRRYTVSYIVNTSPKLVPGVYETTITFICAGRF